ncbi:MAG: efflux RND transporter periplasmic adaptor subunit [Oligoflexales bacterium]
MKTTALLAAVALTLGISCTKEKGGKPPGEHGGGRNRKSVVAVRAKVAKLAETPRTIEMVSVLAGRNQVEVYSRVAGKVSFIGPQEGKRVKQGELLFRVDRNDPGESFLETPVLSPISGWIGRWLVTSIGTHVENQEPVVAIVDDEVLKTLVHLPAEQWLKVSSDTKVAVSLGADKRNGSVVGITRSAESSSSRGTVSIEVNNSDHSWKAGMVANVRFELDTKPRMVVPASALSITDQGSFVFLIKDDKAHRSPVKFSVIDNDTVEILEGVQPGEKIVTEGVNQVGDGLPVKVIDEDRV